MGIDLSIKITADTKDARSKVRALTKDIKAQFGSLIRSAVKPSGVDPKKMTAEINKAVKQAMKGLGGLGKMAGKGKEETFKWVKSFSDLKKEMSAAFKEGSSSASRSMSVIQKDMDSLLLKAQRLAQQGKKVQSPERIAGAFEQMGDIAQKKVAFSPDIKRVRSELQSITAEYNNQVAQIKEINSTTKSGIDLVNTRKAAMKALVKEAQLLRQAQIDGIKGIKGFTSKADYKKRIDTIQKLLPMHQREIDLIKQKSGASTKGSAATLTKLRGVTAEYDNQVSHIDEINRTTKSGVDLVRARKAAMKALVKQAQLLRQVQIDGVKGAEGVDYKKRINIIQKLLPMHQKEIDLIKQKAGSSTKANTVTLTRLQLLKQMARDLTLIENLKLRAVKGQKIEDIRKTSAERKKANEQRIRDIGYTNDQLEKQAKLLRKVRAEKAVKTRAHRVDAAGTVGLEPFSLDQKLSGVSALSQLDTKMQKLAAPERLKAMSKLRDLMFDIRKYAKFQIRWFASATLLFKAAGALTAAAAATFDFYQNLKNIQAVTGTADKDIRKIANAAIAVAKATPIAASKASEMGLKLIQAGLDATQAAQAMKTVAKIVTISGEDMETVSKAVTTAMFAWRLEASEIPKIGNIIAGALNFSRLTVQDLGVAFNYVASTSKVMGRSLLESASAMAVFSNMGIRASTIGTGMSQLFKQLVIPTTKFRKELDRMGVSANAINPSMNKLSDIIKILKDRGFAATNALNILGDRAGRIAATALIAGAEGFERMEAKIGKMTQLQEGLNKAMEGPKNAFALVRNQLEISVIQIGAVAIPALTTLAKSLTSMLSVLTTATSVFSTFANAVGPGFTTLSVVAIPVLTVLISQLILTSTAFTAAAGAAGLFGTALTLISKHPYLIAITAAVTAVSLLGSAFASTREETDDLAGSTEELSIRNTAMKRSADELRQSQLDLKRAITSIKEEWAAAGRIAVSLPFADASQIGIISLTNLRNKIFDIRTELKVLGFDFDKVAEKSNKVALAEAARMANLDDLIQLMGQGGGVAEFISGDVTLSADTISKATARVQIDAESYKNERIKGGLKELKDLYAEYYKSLSKQADEFSKKTPEEKTTATIQALVSARTKKPAERIQDFSNTVKRLYELEDTFLAIAGKAFDRIQKAGTGQEMQKAAEDYMSALQRANTFNQAAKAQAAELDIGWSKIVSRGKDYSKQLEKAGKELAGLKTTLKLMQTTDPFEKINISTGGKINKAVVMLDSIREKAESLRKTLGGKLDFIGPLLPINSALKKQLNDLERQESKYQNIAGWLWKIGELHKKNAKVAGELSSLDIASGKLKLEISERQKLLGIAKQMKTLSPLEILKQEISLKNEALSIDIRRLQVEKQRIQTGELAVANKDLKIAQLELEIATLQGKKTSIAGIASPVIFGGEDKVPAGFSSATKMKDQLAIMRDQLQEKQSLLRVDGINSVKLEKEIEQKKTDISRQENQKRAALAQGFLGAMTSLGSSLMTIQENKAKADGKITKDEEARLRKTFSLQKKLAIASALVSTYQGAAKALGQGGIAGIAMAAIVTAVGLANVAAIQSQRYGGGVSAGASSTGGEVGSYSDLYSWEKSKYGSGWSPSSDQRGAQEKSGPTYIINGDIYSQDEDAFRQKVTVAVQQDIKDGGNTKEVIRNYV